MATEDSKWHTITVRVPFLSPAHASIAQRAIQVDKELQPHAVERTVTVEGDVLVATFSTLTLRLARLTLNGFLENVDLVSRTLMEFGDHAASQLRNFKPSIPIDEMRSFKCPQPSLQGHLNDL